MRFLSFEYVENEPNYYKIRILISIKKYNITILVYA